SARRRLALFEIKSLRQEHGHLAARVRRARAIVAVPAAAGDAAAGQVFDPIRGEGSGGHVPEKYPRRRGRNIRVSEQRLQEKHGHLRARDGVAGTVIVAAAATRDAERGELLDPRREWIAGRHI